MENDYLTSNEAAAFLRLSPATLATWRSRQGPAGSIPFSKLGSRVVYRRADLERFARERRQRSTAETPNDPRPGQGRRRSTSDPGPEPR